MKTHIFVHAGSPGSLCGKPDSDNIAYDKDKKVTCKKCKKLSKSKKK